MPKRLLTADSATTEGARLLRIIARRHAHRVLAQRLGRSISTVTQWIRERRTPDAASRVLIEEVFGIDASSWERRRIVGDAK